MNTILQIDASARKPERSISKKLATTFMNKWLKANPKDKVIHRDLSLDPPGFVTQDWIGACFTSEEKRTDEQKEHLALSDTLIDELDQANIIVISTPMYNYGMPAILKAWVDQVIRINKTFTFDLARGDFPLEPIMSGKKLILISSHGEFGFEVGGIREKMNHLGTHIQVFINYLGVKDFYEIKSEYQEFGGERHEKSLKNAHIEIENLVSQLSS